MNRIQQSHDILDRSKLSNGMWAASTSDDYNFTWFRDTFYIALTYLDKDDRTYERAFYGILDILKKYRQKIEYHMQHKPVEHWERIHIRYDAENFEEIDTPWSHAQNDAIGDILWGIGEGLKRGKKMFRDEEDKEIIQKVIGYLDNLEYHIDEDSSLWEEGVAKRSSSIGAVVAGLVSISDYVYVPHEMIQKGYQSLYELFPKEHVGRDVDLALLTLIYPFNLFPKPMAQTIIHNVESELLREKGVIRYKYDNYYSTKEKEHGRNMCPEFYDQTEPHWVFGLSFLSLAHLTLGNLDKAKYYIDRTEELILEDGRIPELYFAGDYKDEYGNNYNKNTPLLWSSAMHIQAKENYINAVDNS